MNALPSSSAQSTIIMPSGPQHTTSNNSSSCNNIRSSVRVKFSGLPQIHEIPKLVPDENHQLWISRHELKSNRRSMQRTLQVVQQQQQQQQQQHQQQQLLQMVDTDRICWRGMENMLQKSARKDRRKTALKAVLKMQALQKKLKCHENPEQIAKVYTSYALSAKKAAWRYAQQDQIDVMQSLLCDLQQKEKQQLLVVTPNQDIPITFEQHLNTATTTCVAE